MLNFINDSFAYSYPFEEKLSFDYSNNKILTRFINLDEGNINGATTILPSLPEEKKIKLIDLQNISSDDIFKSLRAIAILAINLFLIVIQVVAGILKALLPFLG